MEAKPVLAVEESKAATAPEEKMDPETEKRIESDIELISKLEYYCAGHKFTEPINKFIQENAHHFQEIDESKGYPHEYYVLYTNYIKLIDELLENFVRENKYTDEQVFECCVRINEADPQCLNCLDYIMATTEYEEFYNLMLEHKVRICDFFVLTGILEKH